MAKKMKGKRRESKPTELPPDLEDEVDAFHKQKEKVNLDLSKDADSEEDLEEDDLGVYDLQDSGEDDSEDEDDEHLAKLIRQEKLLRSKVQLHQGDIDGSEDEEEDEARRDWGAKKGAYYEEGEAQDEEDLVEEEDEGRRMQQEFASRLDQRDFDVGSSSSEESLDEEAAVKGFQPDNNVQTLEIAHKTGDSRSDAAEFEAVLSNLAQSLMEVRTCIGPLVSEVRSGELATAEGVSYLEAKNMLLLQYCLHLVFFLLLKAEGRTVKDHPVITRLVEIRAYLDKIRPLDKKLKHQIDKLLTSHQITQAIGGEGVEEIDPSQFRPNPQALVAREEPRQPGKEGLYQPPKINPVLMEHDPDKDARKRETRAAAGRARRSSRSELIRDLAREVADAPDEVREMRGGEDSAFVAAQRARLEKRAAEEEDLMMRVPLSKKELGNLKAAGRRGLSGAAFLDEFADNVSDLVQARP